MQIIDSHTHIYSAEFDSDRREVIARAHAAGICAVMLPNEDVGSIEAISRVCDSEPDFAFPMMGLHPTSVNVGYLKELRQIEAALAKRRYYAIGEIGMDLYWDKTYRREQQDAFETQLHWSAELQIPVSIHTREAFDEVIESIYKAGAERLRGVFHCFTGAVAQWAEIEKLSSFYVGIGGVATFKNSVLVETMRHIPLHRVVVETDAPYLAPVPFRGKRNEPSYVIETIKKLAEWYKIDPEMVAEQTFNNSLRLFNIEVLNA
ncbi:MAG: TatD family hydrolase [Tannerella sp.]|nr:TatD family hydrolase [Tannerella sp.]